MITGILLILSASIFSPAPQQKRPNANALNQPTVASKSVLLRRSAAEITIPFEYFKQHIYVEISVNGTPGLIFMLDSGANEDILNLHTAQHLNINAAGVRPEKNTGFAEGAIDVSGEQAVSAAVGPLQIAHSMTMMDLSSFERHFDHRTDGMLGAPFFEHFVVKLDFQKKLMRLIPAQDFRYRGSGESIKIGGHGQSIVMPVTLESSKYDSRRANVEVDTGSNASLLLYRHCVHPLHLEESILRAQSNLGYGVNGDFASTQGAIDSLWIGRAETDHLLVDYFEPAQTIHPKCEIAGVIGNEVLQSFSAVIFDVPHGRLIFELNRMPLVARVTNPGEF